MQTDSTSSAIALLNEHTFRDPYPTYARLRESDPVHRVAELDVWFLSRYSDIVHVLGNSDGFSKQNTRLELNMHPTVRKFMFTLFQENPDHRRMRSVVERFFTPRNLQAFEARIRAIIDEAIVALADHDEVDLVKTYAYRIPIHVLCLTLGLPRADYDLFEAWAPGIGMGMNPRLSPENWRLAGETYQQVGDYLAGIIQAMRSNPAGETTILSLLVEGCDAGAISEPELISLAVNLYGAAHETTLNLIGLTAYSLLRFPAELEKIKRDPTLWSSAIEEVARFDGAGHMVDRRVNRDIEMHGVQLRENDALFLGIASGNRDPDCCAEPDRFSVDRKQPVKHLGFGHGTHFCVGRLLGRLETMLAVDALFNAFPALELAAEPPLDYTENLFLHGLKRLPVRLGSVSI